MKDRQHGGSRLDAAIDRAVREMMSVEPRGDFRERVLSKIAGTPARTLLWPRFAIGAAAAAVAIALMFQVGQRPSDRPVEQTPVATAPPTPPPRTTERPTPVPRRLSPQIGTPGPVHTGVSAATPGPRVPLGDSRPIQAASIDAAKPPDAAPAAILARLKPINPIVVSTLDAPRVSATAIDIKPITIELIEIVPLTPLR
jgi:hypothetical protein